MLIQDGFPRINETGGYQTSSGTSSNSSPLPGFFEQTQTNIDRGQQSLGLSYVVAHNGLQAKGSGCPFDAVHPKPLRPLDDYQGPLGSKCPNRWVVREGAEGQITGFQVTSPNNEDRGVDTPSDIDLAFQNEWDNSDGIYFETYENVLWLSENTNRGVLPVSRKTVGAWTEDLHRRLRLILTEGATPRLCSPTIQRTFCRPGPFRDCRHVAPSQGILSFSMVWDLDR